MNLLYDAGYLSSLITYVYIENTVNTPPAIGENTNLQILNQGLDENPFPFAAINIRKWVKMVAYVIYEYLNVFCLYINVIHLYLSWYLFNLPFL